VYTPRSIGFNKHSLDELLLRRIARRSVGGCIASLSSAALSKLLDALPLFGRKKNHGFRNEDIILQTAADDDVVAGLDVRHGDALSASAERGVFVEFERLRDVVGAQDGQLRCVNRLHYAGDKVLAHLAECRAASGPRTHYSGAAVRRAAAEGLSGHGVVGIFVAARHDEIADFEVRKLGGLAIFAVFGLAGNVDGYGAAIGLGHLKRVAVDGGNLAYGSVTVSCATAPGIAATAGRRALHLILGCRGRIRGLRWAGNSEG